MGRSGSSSGVQIELSQNPNLILVLDSFKPPQLSTLYHTWWTQNFWRVKISELNSHSSPFSNSKIKFGNRTLLPTTSNRILL